MVCGVLFLLLLGSCVTLYVQYINAQEQIRSIKRVEMKIGVALKAVAEAIVENIHTTESVSQSINRLRLPPDSSGTLCFIRSESEGTRVIVANAYVGSPQFHPSVLFQFVDFEYQNGAVTQNEDLDVFRCEQAQFFDRIKDHHWSVHSLD